jgi:hypothetical protein
MEELEMRPLYSDPDSTHNHGWTRLWDRVNYCLADIEQRPLRQHDHLGL